jgi:hypothetical protein
MLLLVCGAKTHAYDSMAKQAVQKNKANAEQDSTRIVFTYLVFRR